MRNGIPDGCQCLSSAQLLMTTWAQRKQDIDYEIYHYNIRTDGMCLLRKLFNSCSVGLIYVENSPANAVAPSWQTRTPVPVPSRGTASQLLDV